MSSIVNINCPARYKSLIETELFIEVALFTLSMYGRSSEYEVTIAFVGTSRMRHMNKMFLGHDYVTDVLAFTAMEIDPSTQQPYLGDVVICIPKSIEQAKKHGINPRDEVTILIIHGILHLLGYDHDCQENKMKMWELQNKVLTEFNISYMPSGLE